MACSWSPVEECAQAIVSLLGDPDLAAELGRSGRERVREHFLLPRLILDELTLIRDLAAGLPCTPPSAERDPVCGMALTEPDTAPSAAFAGATYRFCSDDCRARFELTPERYAGKQVGKHVRAAG